VSQEAFLQRSPTVHEAIGEAPPLGVIAALLDTLGTPVFVSGRSGRILVANEPAKHCIGDAPGKDGVPLNLFSDLLRADPTVIAEQMENGEQELNLLMERSTGRMRARVRPLSGTDWLVVEMQPANEVRGESVVDGNGPPTVEALLQEREITYRNLLAAYLRLQEVNRQKTVFLASAAHELKTPLAVVKGYYDLLLSNSLGKLNDKQRDILQESKDSCERLVRLVSMFLNYSTLESGKLVLHLRDNDLRDCLTELTTRWSEAFQRKHVRLEVSLDAGLPIFKFDYQKVQQTVANLLDNALKHTPAGGSVTLRAEPHFWERRSAQDAPKQDRRRGRNAVGNSVRVAVTDTGPGIASEHHQEIFEDFVRVDRTSSGMGLGLAIAKRLVQAHRGKIWVDSEPRRGCTFTFLLPRDNS
jgi:signal transduction histidine kinase